MKEEFPLGPFMFMGLTIAACAMTGVLIGRENSDLVGLGIGLVLGIVVFGVLSNMPSHTAYDEMGWRLDAGHSPVRGPQRWLQKVMQSLGIRQR
ncbi:hypothetical protein BH10PLA2_BH10PLA2_36970 [soil metagenome]